MERIVAEGCRERCMDPNSPVSNWVVYFLILVFLHSIFSIMLLYFNHSIVVFCLWILDSQYIGLKAWISYLFFITQVSRSTYAHLN